MQILVYAGAILVIFMFVMVLFQDAHAQIDRFPPNSSKVILSVSVATFILSVILLGLKLFHYTPAQLANPPNFGSVESLGMALYIDYFFPFEAIILLFLVAIIGAFFIARREEKNEY
jgi:NADH-quinone oxidoreductase subunit J